MVQVVGAVDQIFHKFKIFERIFWLDFSKRKKKNI